MRRQERQRQQRARRQRQVFPRWLLLIAAGLVSSVAAVFVLFAVIGVFSGQDSSPTPAYTLTSQKMAELASTGQRLGSPDAPVTILEFGEFQ